MHAMTSIYLRPSLFGRFRHPLLWVALLGALGCQPSGDRISEPHLLIQGVSLVDPASGSITPRQSVRVVGERIREIGSMEAVTANAHSQLIDGSGKFLLPGLAEMHAHIPVPEAGDTSLVKETLFLYLSNGITTIRGMLGDPFHLYLREAVKTGHMLGPRIYTSGPSINGNSAPDIATATRMVREHHEAGYDFLKLHPGIKRPVFDALTAEARSLGMPYAGHVSTFVGIRHALARQYASVDHLDGYLEGLVPPELDPQSNGFFGINFVEEADPALIPELARMTREQDVWVVPTQCLMERWTLIEDPRKTLQQAEMKYMPPETRMSWATRKNAFLRAIENDAEQVARFIQLRRAIIQGLREAGVDFLLGSDAPQIFNVPGFSIQHEMQSMVAAGMSPGEVLASGTRNPARYFQAEGDFGSLQIGSSADLLLLAANPLEDIRHMQAVEGVMVRGTWLPQAEIEARLGQIAKKYERIDSN